MPDNRTRVLLAGGGSTPPPQQPVVESEDHYEDDHPDVDVRGYMHSAETTGTVNGPGVRYTLYLSGCPLRCLYCHNPDTWQMRMGSRTTVQKVVDDIAPFRPFTEATGGGLTCSGGEPLLQPRFLLSLFREVKRQLGGMHTTLDTSGFLGANASDELLDLTDLVLLDVKSGLDDTYRNVTSAELQPTLEFGRRLSRRGNVMWIRYVLVPGLTDAVENVGAVADYLAELQTVQRVEILPYHSLGDHKYAALGMTYPLPGVPAPTPDQVAAARQIFRDRGLTVL